MAEVIIVGAGIIGSAIALELQRRSVQTLLLERSIPGAESSSAAAGMLAPQLEAHAEDDSFELGLFSRALYPEWARSIESLSGLGVDHRVDGAVQLYESEAAQAQALQRCAWQKRRGLSVEPWDDAQLRRTFPGIADRFSGALYYPQEGQIDPRKLMRALSVATRRAGAQHRAATVSRIVVEDDRVRGVALDGELLQADRVIVAAGAWSSRISGAPLPLQSVGPARGQMLALDLGAPRFAPYLWVPGGYLVPRLDGRLLVGATVERVGFEKKITARGVCGLLNAVLQTFPGMGDAPVLETWSGLRPWTPDERPIFGESAVGGLYFATGHYRNGILQAPATAQILADIVTGKESDRAFATAFSPARFSE